MSALGLGYDEVKLQEFNTSWRKEFAREEQKIEGLNCKDIQVIEHVGSTAVPGMSAKPIIDILVGINKYKDFKRLIKPLQLIGYHFHREPRRYQALFLKKVHGDMTSHHLKIVKFNGKSWRDYLRFRDALISDKKLFNDYKKLKISLSTNYPNDRKKYTTGKKQLIQEILRK